MGNLRKIVFVFGLIASLCMGSIDSLAEVVIDNNGQPRENPYGKCESVPSSYEGVEYYDCYLPYAKKVSEIGGTCTYTSNPNYESPIPEFNAGFSIGCYFNYEGHGSGCNGRAPIGYEDDTEATIYEDDNGNRYYAFAIQNFFYGVNDGYLTWSSANRGQLVDLILTNGVVLHFVVADCQAKGHTNGWTGGMTSEGLFECGPLYYTQYRYLFSSFAGNCVEMFGKTSDTGNKMRNKYGIELHGGGVNVALYRMYNKKYTDNPKRTSGVPSGPSYSIDGSVVIRDSTIDSGPNGDQNGNNNGGKETESEKESGTPSDLVPEDMLDGLAGKTALIKDNQSSITLPDGSLGVDESVASTNIRGMISSNKSDRFADFIRTLCVFLGMLMWLYVVILFAAYGFDRANTIFDISLLGIVTFGRLTVDMEENGRKTCFGRLLLICGCLFLVGALLISGMVFRFIWWVCLRLL